MNDAKVLDGQPVSAKGEENPPACTYIGAGKGKRLMPSLDAEQQTVVRDEEALQDGLLLQQKFG